MSTEKTQNPMRLKQINLIKAFLVEARKKQNYTKEAEQNLANQYTNLQTLLNKRKNQEKRLNELKRTHKKQVERLEHRKASLKEHLEKLRKSINIIENTQNKRSCMEFEQVSRNYQ